ncbi:MRN complex-interacting protein [Lates calcarifer]|uniref:MRN complex-interacting protein n=1 Tax=Lates calcarifer TaxID=8187 RepID=A0AAJ7Q209_LATCA|nr:MRN complex-interacting protein [Lates calcarifer]
MVQEFHVVRCFSCESFQVQQVKKVNRWSCKVCGERQSLLKEFGRGSGADCRRHVQKLNATRGAMMEEEEHNALSLWEQVEADGEETPEEGRDDQAQQTQVSRWSKYLDTPEEAGLEEEPEEENVLMDRQTLHGNSMTDRKRKRADSPEQLNCSSLRKRVRPSTTTRTTSPTQSSPTQSSPPCEMRISPPSLSTGAVSRWTRFLSSDCQVQEGEELSVSGWSQSAGGAVRPRPLFPVSSLFEIEDEFNFDDEEFLTDQRV